MQLIPIIRGLGTRIPFLYRADKRPTGGSIDARYCYAVWLRHLSLLGQCGIGPRFSSVAELGPGDSLGIGLGALLTGANRLFALDVVEYASENQNVMVLHQLARLLQSREPIPGADEFPGVYPTLDNYAFPRDMLPDDILVAALHPARVAGIEAALRGEASATEVSYYVPWTRADVGRGRGRVDLVYSQAVLEHIEDIETTHREVHKWLTTGGAVSHVIDFRSHGLTPTWDGHLQYSPKVWKWVRGARPYLLGRRSPGEHLSAIEDAGFDLVDVRRVLREPEVSDRDVHPSFASWSQLDRSTSSMVVVARKKT